MQLKPLTWLVFVYLAVNSNGEERECFAPAIGMETGAILDSQMTASSENDFNKVPFARLNANRVWCPTGDIELTEWIQIDLGRLYRVCAVATQGNPGGNKDYLKEIELGWSNDNITWETSAKAISTGNTNCCDVKKNNVPVIYARYIRLVPLKWHIWPCTRMEIYGEPWPEGPNKLFSLIGLGKALVGHVVSAESATDVTGCMKLCLLTEHCKSFNFSPQMNTCELSNSTAIAQELQNHQNLNYYEPASFQVISTAK